MINVTRTNAFTGFTMSDATVISLMAIVDTLSNLPKGMCEVHAAAADYFLNYTVIPMTNKGARNDRHVENVMNAAAVYLGDVREVPSTDVTSRKSTAQRASRVYKYVTHANCR